MSQSESEQQLRIWKDLAINKQMIMNEAATALKLRGEWTQEELKEALDMAIKRANSADDSIQKMRADTERQLAEMTEKVRAADKARAAAEEQIAEAQEGRETAERQLINGRKENSEALKKAKQQVDEKQRELKAINTALADTPENVVRKLKTLKRQKHEEATGRNKAEEQNRKLKKETKTQAEELEKFEKLTDDSVALLESYRDLRSQCEKQIEALKEADKEVEDLPAVDHDLLGRIEKLAPEAEEA